jgi:hypothetical protein
VTPRETSIQLAFLMPSDVFKTPSGHNNLTSRMIGRLYPMIPLWTQTEELYGKPTFFEKVVRYPAKF